MPTRIPFYNILTDGESTRAANSMQPMIATASRHVTAQPIQNVVAADGDAPAVVNANAEVDNVEPVLVDEVLPSIEPLRTLLGIDQEIYKLINEALGTKKHLIFYGPPGTGKTTLAEYVATFIAGDYVLVTGTSDWTSQDLIGGYQPVGNGQLQFVPGIIIENFDRPIIIDELNRVDIDKAIGPLFTVLSGQQTTLPYQLKLGGDGLENKRIQILPALNGELAPHQFAPSSDWRIFATINTVDKASLYQMSYALSRRFAWILIDVPESLSGFISEYLILKEKPSPNVAAGICPLSEIWKYVNEIRTIGAAPIIDVINLCFKAKDDFEFFQNPVEDAEKQLYINGFFIFLLPMLDGMLITQAEEISNKILQTLNINIASDLAKSLKRRVVMHSI